MATEFSGGRRPLRELLREAGAAPHARLDASFAAHSGTVAGYICLLQTLESFHCSADRALGSWVAGSPAAPAVTIPARAEALRSDMLRLGASPGLPVDLSGLPRDSTTGLLTEGAGLALLYVLAGSSIGARVILRQLSDVVPADAPVGLSEGASPECARLWQTTLVALNAVAPHGVRADATYTCRLVFEILCAHSAASDYTAAS